MRVALVMPMVVTSAVAQVMTDAAAALAGTWDIDIVCPALGPRLQATVPVREFGKASPDLGRELGQYDLVVYAVGDNPWHGEVVRIARELPGLVVLHDVSVTNLAHGLYARAGALDEMVSDARRRYGGDVADALATIAPDIADPAWFRVCAEAPMLEFVLRGSLGVVVHSAWAAAMVEGHTLGTVAVAPLPLLRAAPSLAAEAPGLADVPDDAIVVVTVGSVNANRRIDWIVQGIAGDAELRDRVHVVAAGAVSRQMQRALGTLADRLGMADRVHLTGRVDDDELASIIARADLCAALRDPVLEAKSASLLSQMQAGKAVLVFDHAHYSELPDDVVAKVPVDGGAAAVARAIRVLVDDPRAAAAIGARAQAYVERTHTARAYAAAIVAAGDRALATRPLANLTAGLAQRLDRLGLAGDPRLQATLADTVFELIAAE